MYLVSWEPNPFFSAGEGLSLGAIVRLQCPVCRMVKRIETSRWSASAGIRTIVGYVVGVTRHIEDVCGGIGACEECGTLSILARADAERLKTEMRERITVAWFTEWTKRAGGDPKFHGVRP
jgi:hypothetical protein